MIREQRKKERALLQTERRDERKTEEGLGGRGRRNEVIELQMLLGSRSSAFLDQPFARDRTSEGVARIGNTIFPDKFPVN